MSASPPLKDFFRRPLGLALSGGGALGSWQAGLLADLDRKYGLSFDSVVGFSAGALNGAAFALNLIETAVDRWKGALNRKTLVFSPRLFPLSLFSGRPIEIGADYAADDHESQKRLRSKLTILSMLSDHSRRVERSFDPQGKWDGPLAQWIVASSSIPTIFPPVRLPYEGKETLFIDAGVPCDAPMSFQALAGCQDVIVVEMIRHDENTRKTSGLWGKWDQNNRLGVREFINEGVDSLKKLTPTPRIFRIEPSKHLEFAMLNFRSPEILSAVELGRKDASSLIANPERFLLPS